MIKVEIHLHAELGALVPAAVRRSGLESSSQNDRIQVFKSLPGPAAVKDVIESLGIPHCEIGTVQMPPVAGCNDTDHPVALSDLICDDCLLAVRGARPRPLARPRLLCDQHLGKLARLLRMTGFDTAWQSHWLEPEIARRAVNEKRVVLSRSRALLKRKVIEQAMLIRSDAPDEQLFEVLVRFQLAGQVRMFGRCSRCGGHLHEVAKIDVVDRIPLLTRKWLDVYYLCNQCDHLYWEGTHVLAIRRRVAEVLARTGNGPAG